MVRGMPAFSSTAVRSMHRVGPVLALHYAKQAMRSRPPLRLLPTCSVLKRPTTRPLMKTRRRSGTTTKCVSSTRQPTGVSEG